MMMDCENVRKSLGAFLDEELNGSEAERIRMHVQGCPSCLAEKEQLERLQASLKGVLEGRASGVAFGPFWDGVRRRILEKKPWTARLWDWVRPALYPERLAWAIPVAIVLLLAIVSLEQFFPGWRWGSNRGNTTAVDSIDGHGFNVAVFRESKTKTTVIWLYENQEEEDESAAESASPDTSF